MAILSRVFLVCCIALGFGAEALAQTPPSSRIRGTIEAMDGHTMTVATREGPKVSVKLADPTTVMTVKPVPLASVDPGAYVGIAAEPDAAGKLRAIEVLVFPEAMRGAGEGHYPWDLTAKSNMTNGTVKAAKQGGDGRYLELAYKDAKNEITVPPNVPVVTLAPADWADVKPGAKVFLSAAKQPDGSLTASRVTVSKDGVAPPM